MKIGILQTGHAPEDLRPETGDYDAMFATLLSGNDFDFVSFDAEAGDVPTNPDICDGWLITGSRHGAYEDHPWIAPLEDLIRAIHAAKKPLVGICFGHQIIAQALGGKVEKFAGGWSVGRTQYEIEGETASLMAWHQDQVVEVPAEARVVGASDFCAHAALAYGDHIWTLQPHPEYSGEFISGLIRTRGKGVVPEHQLAEAADVLDRPVQSARMAARMAAVLKGAAQ